MTMTKNEMKTAMKLLREAPPGTIADPKTIERRVRILKRCAKEIEQIGGLGIVDSILLSRPLANC